MDTSPITCINIGCLSSAVLLCSGVWCNVFVCQYRSCPFYSSGILIEDYIMDISYLYGEDSNSENEAKELGRRKKEREIDR